MTKREIEKCENLMHEAIRYAKESKEELEKAMSEKDKTEREILHSKGVQHYGYDFRNIAFLVYICYNASRQWNKYLHIQRKPQRVAFSGVFYSVKWFNLLGWLPYSSPSSHLQI